MTDYRLQVSANENSYSNLPEDSQEQPTGSEYGCERWHDNDGRLCAYGEAGEAGCWMHVVGIGRFHFGTGDSTVRVVPETGAAEADVVDTFYRTVVPMILQHSGREVLHGSAVTAPGGVVALCAKSQTGKSTLAYGLHERGYPLFADDAVVFELRGVYAELTQLPFAVRLRSESAHYFGAPSRESVRVQARADSHGCPEKANLAAVLVLERMESEGEACGAGGQEARIERLEPGEAFSALLPHAYCFTLGDRERKASMIRHYLNLATTVPVLRVAVRSGLEHLPAILDRLEESIDGIPRALPVRPPQPSQGSPLAGGRRQSRRQVPG